MIVDISMAVTMCVGTLGLLSQTGLQNSCRMMAPKMQRIFMIDLFILFCGGWGGIFMWNVHHALDKTDSLIFGEVECEKFPLIVFGGQKVILFLVFLGWSITRLIRTGVNNNDDDHALLCCLNKNSKCCFYNANADIETGQGGEDEVDENGFSDSRATEHQHEDWGVSNEDIDFDVDDEATAGMSSDRDLLTRWQNLDVKAQKATMSRRQTDVALGRANHKLWYATTVEDRAEAESLLSQARFASAGADLGEDRSCFYLGYFYLWVSTTYIAMVYHMITIPSGFGSYTTDNMLYFNKTRTTPICQLTNAATESSWVIFFYTLIWAASTIRHRYVQLLTTSENVHEFRYQEVSRSQKGEWVADQEKAWKDLERIFKMQIGHHSALEDWEDAQSFSLQYTNASQTVGSSDNVVSSIQDLGSVAEELSFPGSRGDDRSLTFVDAESDPGWLDADDSSFLDYADESEISVAVDKTW